MNWELDLSQPGGITLALLPEIVLSVWSMLLLLVASWRHKTEEDQRLVGQLSLAGLVLTLVAVLWLWLQGAHPAGIAVMIALDPFRYAMTSVILLGAIGTVLVSLGYLGREKVLAPEYYVLLLLATVGLMFMTGGADLIVIFLGLELMSVCVYVLAGFNRRSAANAEAALKYFLLGAFASGFLLYGIALIYGATGTMNLSAIDFQLQATKALASNTMLMVGVGLLLVGFGFKVAAVPFHMWTPDVYDGSPTPVTAFMAAAVKAAAFAALTRVVVGSFATAFLPWQTGLWWLAALTMIVGNLIALSQRHLKRMLAYSSIGHAGYLLTAVASGTALGASAVVFYVVAYTLMTLGSFTLLAAMGRDGERDVLIDDLSGLGQRRPWLAFAMAVFMLALLGFPGTAGFIGKWMILSAAVDVHQYRLAVLLVVASVISAGYYLPVIMAMYMKPPIFADAHENLTLSTASRWVVAVAAFLILLLGTWPNPALDVARTSGSGLRPPGVNIVR